MVKVEMEAPVRALDLGLRLSVKETRGEAIDLILETFEELGSIEKTAEALEVSTRTLQRYVSRTPELGRRIDAARLKRNPRR